MVTQKIQLESDEVVLTNVRRHWFVLALDMLGIVVMGALPLFLYMVLIRSVPSAEDFAFLNHTGFLVALYAGWLLVMWMALFAIWTNYYLDIWTITNKRLITVDQQGFFSRTMASFRLDRLQDVVVSVNGVVATMLDYGTLEVQTAGEERNFKVYGLPHPADLKALILQSSDTLTSQKLTQNH